MPRRRHVARVRGCRRASRQGYWMAHPRVRPARHRFAWVASPVKTIRRTRCQGLTHMGIAASHYHILGYPAVGPHGRYHRPISRLAPTASVCPCATPGIASNPNAAHRPRRNPSNKFHHDRSASPLTFRPSCSFPGPAESYPGPRTTPPPTLQPAGSCPSPHSAFAHPALRTAMVGPREP
jgi:hypothetical protein